MRRMAVIGLALAMVVSGAADAAGRDVQTVSGVGGDDMLKLRSGPGTGYKVLVGLPDGTEVINRGCERVGGTPWCEVALRAAPRLKGYVSGHYLK